MNDLLVRQLCERVWGGPYLYRQPGALGKFDVSSLGADGKEGGEGAFDIPSFSKLTLQDEARKIEAMNFDAGLGFIKPNKIAHPAKGNG